MTEQQRTYVRMLEKAVLEAECAMADWESARRKGYIRGARKTVFEAASAIRQQQRAQVEDMQGD